MAPNSGFQGGPFARIFLLPLHRVALGAAAGGILPSVAWLVLRLLESLTKCARAPWQPAPRGCHPCATLAQSRTRTALLWAGG